MNRIARVTASGNVKEFPIPTPDTQPAMMTLGPDGNVWFTEPPAKKIAESRPGLHHGVPDSAHRRAAWNRDRVR